VHSSTGEGGRLLRESAADGESNLASTWGIRRRDNSEELGDIAGYKATVYEGVPTLERRIRRGRSVQTFHKLIKVRL
jgi:hypothetical protein